MKDSLLKLQNGTDIRGVVLENNKLAINFTESDVRSIARGILKWVSQNEDKKTNGLRIAIGMDSRITGPKIKETFIDEFMRYGVSILDCAMATTPAMFMTTVMEDYSCNCGIMITASHLPYYYNGIKIFSKAGGTEKSDIQEILTYAQELYEQGDFMESQGSLREMDLIGDYSTILVKNIIKKTGMSKPLEGMNIIVDAGNGAGGFFANKVLANLGANTKGSQFLEPDGMFPNHAPNPENKEAMESISQAVLRQGADLGIIFDTDVDRSAIVADDGMEINRNNLIAVISSIILEEKPGSVVVTDSITSDGLTEFIHQKGGIHHRFKRGYKNVINESIRINQEEENKSFLAIETSGHAALKENYFLDDGTYLIAKILIEVSKLNQEGKKIQSLIQDLKQPLDSAEYRIKIKEEDFKTYGGKVLEDFREFVKSQENWTFAEPNYEGIKVNFPGGWLLLRMSLHEPVMPLNLETDEPGLFEVIKEKIVGFVKEYHELEF